LAPLERRPLLLVAAAAVAGVPALHCKASPLPFSLLTCSRRLLGKLALLVEKVRAGWMDVCGGGVRFYS
jgi:hypothetical protein